MDDQAKRRYIVICGNDLPSLTCAPDDLPEMIKEFVREEIAGQITINETWLTDAEYDALGDWSP